MRKTLTTLALALGLVMAMAVPLGAAELHDPHQGTACPEGYVGEWHFVNNQHEGVEAYLFVMVDGGAYISVGTADKANRGTQHWWVSGGNTLDKARTLDSGGAEVPGKLVLSDYSCREVKKDR